MSFNRSIFIETPRISRDKLADSMTVLKVCWKCGSLLWMQSNGYPVLQGLILKGWVREDEAAVSRFCRERNFSELLISLEKPGDRWTRRRGGYTIPLDKVRSQVEELASEGMITILLEPASPYLDTFSLTSVCALPTRNLHPQPLGPPFDPATILRPHILPHT